MTRETKIGLLVGLAFIIVVGILLGDHFSSLQEPKPAPIAAIGENVRTSAGNPRSTTGQGPSITIAQDPVVRGAVPGPQERRLERMVEEMRSHDARIEIGPGAVAGSGNATNHNNNTTVGNAGTGAVANGTNGSGTNGTGHSLVERHPDIFEHVGAGGSRNLGTNSGTGTGTVVVPAPEMKTHKAEPGDNLSKLAARYLGSNTKANRDAIIRVNPSLQANPNIVVVGKVYNIPTPAASNSGTTPPPPGGTVAPVPVSRTVTPTPVVTAPPTPAAGEVYYTTKPGDTLWRIAVQQCGSARAQSEILRLNASVISDPNRVPVNVKLKLPARTGGNTAS